MDKEAIASIIATARHHNPRLGITGLLVYGQGIFFQWLEGPHEPMKYNTIELKEIKASYKQALKDLQRNTMED